MGSPGTTTLIGTTRPSWSPAREPGVALGPRPVLPRGREEVARPGLQLDRRQESRPQRTTVPRRPAPSAWQPRSSECRVWEAGKRGEEPVYSRSRQDVPRSPPGGPGERPLLSTEPHFPTPWLEGWCLPRPPSFPLETKVPSKGPHLVPGPWQETRRAREFPTVPGPFATCFFT